MDSELLPTVLAVVAHQCEQPLVLLGAPALLGLVGEAPVSTVAHLGVASVDQGGDLLETGVLVFAEPQQQAVLLPHGIFPFSCGGNLLGRRSNPRPVR